jgi:hypothetical protein
MEHTRSMMRVPASPYNVTSAALAPGMSSTIAPSSNCAFSRATGTQPPKSLTAASPSSLKARRSLFALENLSAAIGCVLAVPGTLRRIVIAADPNALTIAEMIAATRDGLGRKANPFNGAGALGIRLSSAACQKGLAVGFTIAAALVPELLRNRSGGAGARHRQSGEKGAVAS